MPKPYNPTKIDGRIVADENYFKVLLSLRDFGHLRRSEIATAVWPRSSAKSAYVMACRTVNDMLKDGFILERRNAHGGNSYTLSQRGAGYLHLKGLDAQAGYSQALHGTQFSHRTFGTCYLLEQARRGDTVFGEHALHKGFAPLSHSSLFHRYGKAPDGLVVKDPAPLGLKHDLKPVDWIEVEFALKKYEKLKKALALFSKPPYLREGSNYLLNKLVFVCIDGQGHENRILSAIAKFLKENPSMSATYLAEEIHIATCQVAFPLAWKSYEQVPVKSYMEGHKLSFEQLSTLEDPDD